MIIYDQNKNKHEIYEVSMNMNKIYGKNKPSDEPILLGEYTDRMEACEVLALIYLKNINDTFEIPDKGSVQIE